MTCFFKILGFCMLAVVTPLTTEQLLCFTFHTFPQPKESDVPSQKAILSSGK